MAPKFNIDRPKISDEEIKKHQDFDKLVRQFKEQSLKKAQGDESWWANKKIRYATVIAGITVVCTISYFSIAKKQSQQTSANETLTTPKKEIKRADHSAVAYVKEPSQKLKVNYNTYKVNTGKAAEITHSTGSKIKVPENAFVDKNGHDIKGEVTIEYREFHDLGDIIASGIPMNYDSAGKTRHFESAGMFDIKGHQDGEPVFIKPEKKISVQLASAKSENRFNQYYLDTAQRNWQYLKHDNAHVKGPATTINDRAVKEPVTENKKTELLKQHIEVIIPKRIDSVKTAYTKKAEKLPVAQQPLKPGRLDKSKPTFRIDGSYDEFPELAAFNNVVFEVGAENRNYSRELHEITWSDLKISQGPEKGKNYLLTLSYRQRKEQLVVYPVLAGADYEKAAKVYEEKLVQYEEKKEKRLKEEKRLLAEMEAKQSELLALQRKQEEELKIEKARILARYDIAAQNELASNFSSMNNKTRTMRLFEVAKFGIYNSDCAKPAPEGPVVIPNFTFNSKAVSPHMVYFVDHSSNMVITLSSEENFRFYYTPGNVYSICVFDKNRIYLCNKALFDEAVSSGANKFPVTQLKEGSDNIIDFKKALEI